MLELNRHGLPLHLSNISYISKLTKAGSIKICSYEEWKSWLCSFQKVHESTADADTWIYNFLESTKEEIVRKTTIFGNPCKVVKTTLRHKICGAVYDCYELRDAKENILALCGYSVPEAVYLAPAEDATWTACIGKEPPSKSHVLLCSVGEYPAELFWLRFDLNGNALYNESKPANSKELVEALNWIGKCRGEIVSLWSFDIRWSFGSRWNPEKEAALATNIVGIRKLYSESAQRRWEIAQEDIDAFLGNDDTEESEISGLLDD